MTRRNSKWGGGSFEVLLWQGVRIRVAFYRHLIQRPMVGGLQWFTRAFGRIRAARGRMGRAALFESARRMSYPALALELRFKPATTAAALARQIDEIVPTGEDRPDVGLILHLTRSRGAGHRAGRPEAYDRGTPAAPGRGESFRYAAYYRARRREARAVIELLRTRPGVIEVVRGIDLCGDELAIPLWVLGPLIKGIRDVGRGAAQAVSRPGRAADPIRLMVHAGEDYVHLLGGLRRIDTLVERLGLGEGDRIAHGLALGEDIGRWCDRAFGRVQSREERLLDLLWAWRRLTDEPSAALATWGTWLEARIRRLCLLVFEDVPAIETLAEARAHLHDSTALAAMGFPERPRPATGRLSFDLACRWISDRGIFQRGRVAEEVDPRPAAPLIEHLQRRVRQRVGARSVVVEVNPSSNLLIGGFGDLARHPFWQLRPIDPDGAPSLMVTIGSDDHVTFATTLGAEYQLVYDTLIEGGVSPDRALAWLDDARRASLRARVARSRASPDSPCGRRWPRVPCPLPDVFLPG